LAVSQELLIASNILVWSGNGNLGYKIETLSNENFVVVMMDINNIFIQLFTSSGVDIGAGVISVTSANSGSRTNPGLCAFDDGTFLVTWNESNLLKAQLFANSGVMINSIITFLRLSSTVTSLVNMTVNQLTN